MHKTISMGIASVVREDIIYMSGQNMYGIGMGRLDDVSHNVR